MKLTDLPPKSRARRLLRKLSREARRERLRCADAVLVTGYFAKLTKELDGEFEPYLRCESILRDILRDDNARLEWFDK